MLILLLACERSPGLVDSPPAPPAQLIEARITPLYGPYVQAMDLELDAVAPVAVACTAQDDAAEVHLLEDTVPASSHRLRLSGLRELTTYVCRLLPEGGEFELITGEGTYQHERPAVIVEGAPRLLLTSVSRTCDPTGARAQLVVFDERGRVRWAYTANDGLHGDLAVHHEGDGVFSFGGGGTREGAPALVDLEGVILGQVVDESVQFYHHEGRLVEGGLLALAEAVIPSDEGAFEGADLLIQDPETGENVWEWRGADAVAAGDLPKGTADAWHANGASREGDLVVLSLCRLNRIMGIDMATGRQVWSIDEKTECQHGVDFLGDRVLVHDNGVRRSYSRVVELSVPDGEELWEWTEPGWWEPSYGDVDQLDEGRVLITQGHVPCGETSGIPSGRSSIVEVDRATGDVQWRLSFFDAGTTVYRSDTIDECALFDEVGNCPALAARLEELGG